MPSSGNKRIGVSAFLLFCLFCFSLPLSSWGEEDGIPRVILVTVSGVRNSETIADPAHQYIPHLWKDLFPQGTLYTNLISLSYEFHNPVQLSLHDGTVHKFFQTSSTPYFPTIFQYVRERYNLPTEKVWVFGQWFLTDSWKDQPPFPRDRTAPAGLQLLDTIILPEIMEKIRHILDRSELATLEAFETTKEKNRYYPQWDSFADMQYKIFKKVLQNIKPIFIHYISGDVEAAHFGHWGRYALAVKRTDEEIYDIWQMIQTDPYYKGKTYLIVSIDHSRDALFKTHYSNTYQNPSRVWLYVFGPDIKQGAVIDRPVYHTDIFATIAHIMDVKTHPTPGKVLQDSFKDSPSKESDRSKNDGPLDLKDLLDKADDLCITEAGEGNDRQAVCYNPKAPERYPSMRPDSPRPVARKSLALSPRDWVVQNGFWTRPDFARFARPPFICLLALLLIFIYNLPVRQRRCR